jgi:hypothetical protein
MFPQLYFTRKYFIVIFGVILITGIVAALWLFPRALALYHQVKGGMILSQVMQPYLKNYPGSFACEIGALSGDRAKSKLKQAIAHLVAARGYDPSLAQTYLLLGRAYCLYGEPQNAILAYGGYFRLHPNNPLGHLESGLAYAEAGQQEAINEWLVAGVTPDQILSQAEKSFNLKDYWSAANWYSQSAIGLSSQPISIILRWAIAATLSGLKFPESAYQILPVFMVNNTGVTHIEAGNFRWLREIDPNILKYGDKIFDHPGKDPSIARMWWSGDAIGIISIPSSGKYSVSILAQNTVPPPIQMALTVDLVPVYQFEMERGDLSWVKSNIEIYLTAGFHVIGLRFINNGVVNGIDRDAVINWLEIEEIK